jgi:hypothetical protein
MKQQTKQIISLVCIVLVFIIIVVFFVRGGFFFPRSNQGLSSTASTTVPASLSLIGPSGSTIADSAVTVGSPQYVTWTSTNYAAPSVSVNIIRKVSDNPAQYELVRTVAKAMSNKGDALWIPLPSDAGENTFVQIDCALSSQACQASPLSVTAPLAVIDTGAYDNMASVYTASFEAAEALYNR